MLDESTWQSLRSAWAIPEDVTYLNHGSFGPTPEPVRLARQEWSERLAAEPMDFFVRRMERYLDEAAARLGAFVGADPANLAFVDNATFGMNVVAATVPLQAGDEVLLTDHEYGAVTRIWRRRCQAVGAKLTVARLPLPVDTEGVRSAIEEALTERTRLVVMSHVTSPTAVELPVGEVCRAARSRGVPVCVDGPHAVAMRPLELDGLGCDFYCASGHKWLCAPLGSGFLYVAPRWQEQVQPVVTSWGGSVSNRPARWQDELNWIGTRDPAAFLALPAAIAFLEGVGWETFRAHGHAVAEAAVERLSDLCDEAPVWGADRSRFGTMAAIPLPPSPHGIPHGAERDPLQTALWERYRIEAPVVHWSGRRFLRVSGHVYNRVEDVEQLVGAVHALIGEGEPR